MIKVSLFHGEDEQGVHAIPLFGSADRTFEKTAEPLLLPEVSQYIATLRPRPDAQYVLVNAMGAGEYWGSNINGDHFPEAALVHTPKDWTGNPLLDKIRSKDWPYGFPTFYFAHPYAHHRNKDATRAFGEVELAAWNPRMKRVELVTRVDEDKCQKFGGTGVWDKLKAGQYPDVSMGCKVPYDTCSICLDWATYRKAQATFIPGKDKSPGEAILRCHKALKAKNGKGIRGVSITRADYCDHAKKQMNKILPDGRKVFVYNDYPKFFDISFVFIGADKTAKTMMKIAGGGQSYWFLNDAAMEKDAGVREEVRAYLNHSALNLGLAAHDIRHLGTHEYADKMGPKGSPRHVAAAVAARIPSLAENVYYAAIPPQLHHTPEELRDLKNRLALKGEFLHGYNPDAHPDPLVTKSASDNALKLAFLGKAAKNKDAEIIKDVVPSQFASKAIPALTRNERDLPERMLDVLGSRPLSEALSTTSGLGMVLRPREFQRIVLIRMGQRDLADECSCSNTVFPRVEESLPFAMGPSLFSPALARMLFPFLAERSALGPSIEKRVLIISATPQEKHASASSHSSALLRKIGAAYNAYRAGIMDLVAHAQDLVASTAPPSEMHLHKLASLSADAVFTPLSVCYLKQAFWDETGAALSTTSVERGLPSRNTWDQSTKIAGGH